MAWNSQIEDNEHTTAEQRKKQHASRKEFTPGYKLPETPAEAIYETVTINRDGDNKLNEYKSLMAQVQAEKQRQLDAAFNSGKAGLDNARLAAEKDAYIAHMRGLKNMPQISAVSGNGGYAQSLLNKQQLNYENNRAGIAQQYMDDLRQLQLNRDNGIFDAKQNYLTEVANFAKSAPKTTASTSKAFTGKYKVGDKTMTRSQYMDYLIGHGMTAEEAAAYMEKNGIPF